MKIRRISEFQGQFRFSNFDTDYDILLKNFHETDLGKIDLSIPWKELEETFNLVEHDKGPDCLFSPKGKLALMFLKNYAGCSDKRLVEQLNGSLYYQIFCDLVIPPDHPIKNHKIVSQIRCELSESLSIDTAQQALAKAWLPYLKNKDSVSFDATCYESYIRYPTDIKLLYEAVIWNFKWYRIWCKELKQKQMRSKYIKWMRRYHNYSKSRRPTKKERRAITKGLLNLLSKVNESIQELEIQITSTQTQDYKSRRLVTQSILVQQSTKFYEGINPEQRIVSMDKPYIRPIVRGKETKSVEFGAKVHKLQIDGIGFIEHLSFENFNEGTRLRSGIYLAQKLTQTKVKIVGADGIYASNKNRNYVSENNIKTDFKRKGRPSKYKDQFAQLAKSITKERASRLEGSFGTDKEHFLLNHIRARTEKTERLWIFFGIHCANALNIGKRMANQIKKAA